MLSTTTNHSQKDDANGWLLKQKSIFLGFDTGKNEQISPSLLHNGISDIFNAWRGTQNLASV